VIGSGQLGTLFAHPAMQVGDQRSAECLPGGAALIDGVPVDVSLDLEHPVDPLNRLQTQRRYHDIGLALRFASSRGGNVGEHEELAPCVSPASGLHDRARFAIRLIQLAIAAKSVGLQDAAVRRQVRLRMFPAAIARIVEHGCRRSRAAEWPIIADIDPSAGKVGLAAGQHRNRGVVAVQPIGRHDMGLQKPKQRHQHLRADAYLVGQGG
jgi:hypothetical protein